MNYVFCIVYKNFFLIAKSWRHYFVAFFLKSWSYILHLVYGLFLVNFVKDVEHGSKSIFKIWMYNIPKQFIKKKILPPLSCLCLLSKINWLGVSIMAQWKRIWLGIMRLRVQPHSLGKGSGVAVSRGIGRRHGSDPVLLQLWHGVAAVAMIWPLAWGPPYATGAALQSKKKKKKKSFGYICIYLFLDSFFY